ncbi:MerR family transcriptional regulator [Companilactobacillus sp. DQM5]|uniref:MerR family transcriptional regulator n=1 Tax=Companilactobacillus sp. DQM5 TaxID=3463359 RepID=UPI00405A0402
MKNYSIGEISKKTNMSTSTIRYYEKEGLLPFIKRDSAQRRKFNDVDLGFLEVIDCMKKSAIPIKEIADFMELCMKGDSTLNDRYNFLDKHEAQLIQKIHDLEDNLEFLRWKKWYYKRAMESGTEEVNFLENSRVVDPELKENYEKNIIHKKLKY